MLKSVRLHPLRLVFVLLSAIPCLLAQGQTDLVNPAWQDNGPVRLLVTAWQQNFTLDEPVIVKATLKNEATEPQTLVFAPEASFSVEFNIFDRNRNLLEKRSGIVKLPSADLKPDLLGTRQIRLCPDEEFSVKIDLNNWYAFNADGRYLVQAVFNDGFNRRKVWSNPLWINVKPNQNIRARLKIEDEIRQQEADTVMTPEGTVCFLLDALKEKDWESFFKYVNLEKLIMLYRDNAEAWKAAVTDEERQEVLDSFRDSLKKNPEYNNLETYRIQNIVFPRDGHERVIYCYVKYNRNIAVNNYLYTFHLQQKGNKWYLYNMETVITKERDWGGFDSTKNPLGPARQPQ